MSTAEGTNPIIVKGVGYGYTYEILVDLPKSFKLLVASSSVKTFFGNVVISLVFGDPN